MRRFRNRQTTGLFRGGELPKLMTMVGMLVVLAMIIRKARDEDTWRFFTGEPAPLAVAPPEEVGDERPHAERARATTSGGKAGAEGDLGSGKAATSGHSGARGDSGADIAEGIEAPETSAADLA
ncbi:MAG TPA: hypothetical protein VMF30_19945, partial [Pirellulales bacterium]|nr:hypothetical protein [Pirellulales bacterium]